MTDTPGGLAKAVKRLGLSLGPGYQAFFVQGSDRPGTTAGRLTASLRFVQYAASRARGDY